MIDSKKGFTIVELLLAAGIVAAMMGGVATYVKLSSDTKRKLDTGLALSGIKENMIRTMNSGAAWTVMVAENPSLACLKVGSPGCADGTTGPIAVYDSSGKMISGVQQTSGFDRSGEPCNTYNPAGSTTGCVFRYNVRWTAMCSFTPCLDPQIRVTGELEYSPTDPKHKNEVDSKRYSFNFFRSETVMNSLEAVCVSIGGTFNAGTNSCQLPWSNFTCPQGTVIRGLNAGNQPNCYYPSAVACDSSTTILRAVDSGGLATVANQGCQPLTCTGDMAPTGWKEEPPGLSFSDWTSSGSGDGGCDGADGGCGS